jgi:hypothetical protein
MNILFPITFVAGALFALFFMAIGPLFFNRNEIDEYLDDQEEDK